MNAAKKPPSFEESFQRLETILEKMNEQEIPLEEALTLFEEANGLITQCQNKLNEAEKRIEIVTRDRKEKLSLEPYQENVP